VSKLFELLSVRRDVSACESIVSFLLFCALEYALLKDQHARTGFLWATRELFKYTDPLSSRSSVIPLSNPSLSVLLGLGETGQAIREHYIAVLFEKLAEAISNDAEHVRFCFVFIADVVQSVLELSAALASLRELHPHQEIIVQLAQHIVSLPLRDSTDRYHSDFVKYILNNKAISSRFTPQTRSIILSNNYDEFVGEVRCKSLCKIGFANSSNLQLNAIVQYSKQSLWDDMQLAQFIEQRSALLLLIDSNPIFKQQADRALIELAESQNPPDDHPLRSLAALNNVFLSHRRSSMPLYFVGDF
jgi:hypothetical protein